MGPFRRDGRLRPATLWTVFVVALLVGALMGWGYRWWTQRTVGEHALDALRKVRSGVEHVTK